MGGLPTRTGPEFDSGTETRPSSTGGQAKSAEAGPALSSIVWSESANSTASSIGGPTIATWTVPLVAGSSGPTIWRPLAALATPLAALDVPEAPRRLPDVAAALLPDAAGGSGAGAAAVPAAAVRARPGGPLPDRRRGAPGANSASCLSRPRSCSVVSAISRSGSLSRSALTGSSTSPSACRNSISSLSSRAAACVARTASKLARSLRYSTSARVTSGAACASRSARRLP